MIHVRPIDLGRLKVLPLAQRKSLTRVEDILIDPTTEPRPVSDAVAARTKEAAANILGARQRDASVILMYGAHLLRNGAALIVTEMMQRGWITHLATNGAGTIHDWEYACLGGSTENVEENVATGTFGTWDETGRNIHLARLAGALQGLGYGRSLGKFIIDDGATLPAVEELVRIVTEFPGDPMAAACADLLAAMQRSGLAEGRHEVPHGRKEASMIAQAWRLHVPVTVHPGIGYDIIS